MNLFLFTRYLTRWKNKTYTIIEKLNDENAIIFKIFNSI